MTIQNDLFRPNPKAQARVLALKHGTRRSNGPVFRLTTVWLAFCLSFVVCLLSVYGL